ncbi:HlyD family efflux transporter periplasmic adaptor subunit [Heliobacterium chlorum]|uniref:HlyD family efflux transporter periplasmic adaptor subunit n=1 Tax=Heliobacterium chlorum TaxID=2698 RepID=A0ABR7SZX9_HELCL|nr:HlyD family efflux transporter periplasmic adaptor subunit [Heliobacterium chlorum]
MNVSKIWLKYKPQQLPSSRTSIGGLLLLALLLTVWYLLPGPTEVETVAVDQGPVQKDLWISGEVKTKRQITIFSSLPGPIEWLVEEGQRVSANEAVAQVGGQSLTTSIAGQLIEKKVVNGSWVPPGTPLAEVADPSDLVIQAMVDETDVLKLSQGQPVLWSLTGYSGETFTGKVLNISRMVSRDHEGNKGFRVLLSVPPQVKLYVGMTAEGRVILEETEDAVRVSVDSLWDTGGDTYVYALRGGRAAAVKVDVGLRDDNYAQVLSGLQPGDRVIIPHGVQLTSGQSVRSKTRTKT